jgi:catechol 2,3-dioxygenase-like lactoylglutathione lyase family enzyme
MNRFHVHIAVDELEASIRFYSAMFGAEPCVRKDDYAKWMLDDPCINFAISKRSRRPGINHLGIQVESDADLDAMRRRLTEAEIAANHAAGDRLLLRALQEILDHRPARNCVGDFSFIGQHSDFR